MPRSSKVAWSVVIALLSGIVVFAAGSATDEELEGRAAAFVKRFVAGEYGEYGGMMSPDMKAAMPAEAAGRILAGLTNVKGAVKGYGDPWKEDVVQGYTRVRVPVEFERGMLDMRIVFDGEGLVAGFFHVAHSEPPAEGAEAKAEPTGRPQEPRRPLPYGEEEVSYRSGDVELAGTLTMPPGEGPHPAALLISGSGPQNRDEEVMGHRPFLVLSDHLTRAGIAVLRVDDRGVGGSSGDLSGSTSADLAEDALAGVRFLRARKEIDDGSVGVVGHSEGGMIGPLAATLSNDVAFVVMLAGTGVPGDEVLVRQMELILRSAGAEGQKIESILASQRKLLDLVLEDAEYDAVLEQMRKLTALQIESVTGSEPAPDDLEEALRTETNSLMSPWFRSFLSHDPEGTLKKVKVPVLALFGELDLQVEPGQNMPKVEGALMAAGNADFTVKTLPGLNHLFQKAKTGAVGEYATIEETMNPAALEAVSGWILERFGTE
jgi:pimeloyl-ACP methyl ester carboxylesterase